MARKTKEKHGLMCTTKTSTKVILYLLLVSLLYLGMSITYITDVNSSKLSTELSHQSADTAHSEEARTETLRETLFKAAFLIVIAGLGILGFFYYLKQKILTPLNRIAASLEKIINGNLGETVLVKGIDEVCRVSTLINDISSNFQETLLITASLNNSSLNILEKLNTVIDCTSHDIDTVLREELTTLRDNMEELNEVIQSFQFYKVKINDGHIHNIEPSGEDILKENDM